MKSSRCIHLERELSILGFNNALRALDLVVNEMSSTNGFARHDGSDYYFHLIDVTQMLLNFGFKQDETLITASLLHDYMEDVEGVTEKLIAMQFGQEVAEVVSKLSKKKGIDYKNNHDEMMSYLNDIEECWRASLIKTADRVHNFQSMKDSSLKHRKAQLKNTLVYFIPFFKRCRKRYVRHEAFFFSAKTNIEPIANEFNRYISDIETLEHEIQMVRDELNEH